MQNFIQHLESQLTEPLPGERAHARMMHGLKRENPQGPGPDARKAGVLLLLFPTQASWQVVFIRRKMKSGSDAHRGQIGLPGGKFEGGDLNLAHTAVRETEEEIGVARDRISVLGSLSELYIPVSNFRVYPFVGVTDHTPAFQLQEEEVEDVITVPLEYLRDPAIEGRTRIQTPTGYILHDVPYFDLSGHVLWGATAMIVSEFLEVIGVPDNSPVR